MDEPVKAGALQSPYAERQVATRTDRDIYSKMMLFRLGSDQGRGRR
jgi:hypothetical protein